MISCISEKDRSDFGNRLLEYINQSPTAFHAAGNCARILEENGFSELKEGLRWKLAKAGKYYVRRNSSSVIAFEIGNGDIGENGFHIVGAHTDTPGFKVKPGNCVVTGEGYVKLNTEAYGGAIVSTWFDRPLSAAGRVVLKAEDESIDERIIDLEKPILVIPNLCIHFQKDVNENNSYNKQTDVLPLLGLAREGVDKGDYVLNLISDKLGIEKSRVLDYELFLYEYDKGILMGADNEFISASRLDNLSMVFCGLTGLVKSEPGSRCKVLAVFDNEEVGSTTEQGANSTYLTNILKRICISMGLDEEGYYTALANSFSMSADTGHAAHPNYVGKNEPEVRPVPGGGPIIKYSAAQRYVTNAKTAAFFIRACEEAGVPYQKFAIRSDMVGGSTIGPSMSSSASIKTVDVGTAILAMHSIREYGSLIDNVYMAKVFERFYCM